MRGLEFLSRSRIPVITPGAARAREITRRIGMAGILPEQKPLPRELIEAAFISENKNTIKLMGPLFQNSPRGVLSGFSTEIIPALAPSTSLTRQETYDVFLLNSEMRRAIQRREKNRLKPPEEVASTAEEDRHDIPTEIASQAIHINTPQGSGWIPVEATHDLEKDDLSEIEEIFFVKHGVKRNVKDYFQFMKDALGKNFDPRKTLIISTQFTNEIDLEGKDRLWQGRYNGDEGIDPKQVLHYGFNDWRGAEPAQNPTAPVDSFTAMDAVIEHIIEKTPKVRALRFRGNSEGGQMLDRYLAYSKVLKELEKDKIFVNNEWKPKIEIEGFVSNPGTVHYFDPIRPDLILRTEDSSDWKFDWIEFPENSEVNIWPFGLYDPPPYIIDYLTEYSAEVACEDYIRRVTLGVGTLDNELGGSQLPVGPGFAYFSQGLTRLERVLGKHAYIKMLDEKFQHNLQIFLADGVAHDGRSMIKAYEISRHFYNFYKKYDDNPV